ncbi:MAG: LysR family transcriptional regulator [Rhodoglobus sp.]
MSDSSSVSEQAIDSSPVSLDDLRVFLAVATSGSFRSAASQLFISQPTLSRAVARLEAQLGIRILSRGPRGVILTEAGETLVDGARNVLDAAAALKRDVAKPRTESLQLGATATSTRSILAPYLAQWIPNNPTVHLSALEDSDMHLQARLENGDCDLAIISADHSPRIESLKLYTVSVTALVPFGHRLAGSQEPLSIIELSKEPLLLNGDGYPSTNLVLRALEQAGLSAEVVFQCSAGQTLAAMAEAGLGVAVFGDTTSMRGFSMTARPVVDGAGAPLQFTLYIAWNRSSASALIKEFAVGFATFSRARDLATNDSAPTDTPNQGHAEAQ